MRQKMRNRQGVPAFCLCIIVLIICVAGNIIHKKLSEKGKYAMKEKQYTGHIMALVCVTIWGSTFVVSKGLMEFLNPVQLMLLRFVLAYAALWVVHPKWYFKWREEWRFLLMALFANTLYYLAENTAITLTQTTNVSILVSTSPIVTALLLPLFYKDEKPNPKQAAGFAVSFIGVVMVVFNGAFALKLQPLGDLLALGAAVCWAVYGILLRRWSDLYDSALISRKLMFYGTLMVIPMVVMSGQPIDFASLMTVTNLAKLAFLGFVGCAVCYLLWNGAICKIGVLTANIYIYLVPLVTLVVSAVVIKEKITLMGFAGILLVIAGMVYATLAEKKQ